MGEYHLSIALIMNRRKNPSSSKRKGYTAQAITVKGSQDIFLNTKGNEKAMEGMQTQRLVADGTPNQKESHKQDHP
ncbi:hypothetical protein U1Q18_047969 [Sarracenia purpurea var. burkii]